MVLGRFSLDRYPWLADHVIRGHPVLPAAVLLELTAYLAAGSARNTSANSPCTGR